MKPELEERLVQALCDLALAQQRLAQAAETSIGLQKQSIQLQAGHLSNAEAMIHGLRATD